MRIAAFVFFALIFAAVPLSGAANAQTQAFIVSDFDCRQPLPCDQSNAAFPTNAQLITQTNSCVSRMMATEPSTSVFDELAGLDSNGCLTTNPAAFPAKAKVTNVPQCCIRKLPVGICVVHCNVLAQ